MSAVDWVLLVIVVLSGLAGLMRGFIGVLASLVAWVLGIWVAFHFGAELGRMLAGTDQPGTGHLIAGYALSFMAVLVVMGLAGWMVRKLVHSIGLSGVDRLLGLVIGTLRGALIACALVLLFGLTSMPREPWWRTSTLIPVFVPGAVWLSAWLPVWVAGQVDFGSTGEFAPADGTTPDHGPALLPVPPGGSGRAL